MGTAEAATETADQRHSHVTAEGPVLMPAGPLIGYGVVNSRGELLGTIDDIMLDVRSGQVAYAILGHGGVLGVGRKLVAVPWDAMRISTRQEKFILDVDTASVEQATTLDMMHPPAAATRWWGGEYAPYYGGKP